MPDTAPSLALRAELAGLNASAPPQQKEVDGWLIRLSPGKAKRSRCINALKAGSLPVDEVLARCQRSFEAASLPFIVRLTPWSQPPGLDEHLAAKGWKSFDAADVLVLDHHARPSAGLPITLLDAQAYAATVGALRGSSAKAIAAHAERTANSTVPYQGFGLFDEAGGLLACGQIVLEGSLVGLYDIASARPRQGHAERLCRALLATAYAWRPRGLPAGGLRQRRCAAALPQARLHLGLPLPLPQPDRFGGLTSLV